MITIPIEDIKDADVLLSIAKELNTLYSHKREALPYGMNIITELHANENANSRILGCLLKFSRNGRYVLLDSFIKLMQSKCGLKIDINIQAPIFSHEENRIDLLIKEGRGYAIIIENKIWNAVDQDKQIERYVDYARSSGIPKNKIFVIYLTGDDSKKVSNKSLTAKARKDLRVSKKNDGRFICMSFKNDIVPWIDEVMQMEIVSKEPLLSSAIIQYSDYLKAKFGLRNDDKIIENQLEIIMAEKLQINNLNELLQIWTEVDKLNTLLSDAADNRIESMCKKKIYQALEKKGYIIKEYIFRYNCFHLGIEIPEWKKSWWVMSSENRRLFYGIWKMPEKKIAQKYISQMSSIYSKGDNEGFIKWEWANKMRVDDAFWEEINTHSVRFVNSIVIEIERVREATKDMNL